MNITAMTQAMVFTGCLLSISTDMMVPTTVSEYMMNNIQ